MMKTSLDRIAAVCTRYEYFSATYGTITSGLSPLEISWTKITPGLNPSDEISVFQDIVGDRVAILTHSNW